MFIANFFINTLLFGLLALGLWRKAPAVTSKIVCGLGGFAIVWLVSSSLVYLFLPMYWDHAEASIAAVAAFWSSGEELYSALDFPARYSMIYGPLPFVLARLGGALPFDILWTSKVSGIVCLWFTLFCLVKAASFLNLNRLSKVIWVGSVSALLLGYENMSYWNRADSFLLAAVSIVLISLLSWPASRRNLFYVMTGVIVGCAVSAKIHGFVYFIPLFALLWEERRDLWQPFGFILSAVVCIAAVGFPFLFRGVSFLSYLEWLKVASHVPRTPELFFKTLTFSLPGVLTFAALGGWKKHRWIFVSMVFTCLLVAFFASKRGAGYHHSLPLVPVFFFFLMRAARESSAPSLFAKWLLAGLVCASIYEAFMGQKYFIQMVRQVPIFIEAKRELLQIRERAHEPIELGFANSGTYSLTFLRPLMVERGHLLIDSAALMEMQGAGLDLPSSTVNAIRDCRIHRFVFPREEEPWSLISHYGGPLLPEVFREEFYRRYKEVESTSFFRVYACSIGGQ